MTREELEAEARRIGVIAPERLGRAALERRLRDHHASPIRRARRAFRGLVGIAKAIAGAPPSLPRDESRGTASPKSEVPSPSPSPSPKSEVRSPSPSPSPSPTSEVRLPKSEPIAKGDELADEPIPTRTMARLLADQGHARRALAIYRNLLREQPGDEDLRQEIDRLESSVRGRTSRKGSRDHGGEDDESEGVEVVALPVGRASVLVAWSVAGRALAEAEALLQQEGELEARVVVVRADSEGAIRREVRERPAESAGEWVVPVYAGARVTAAVGLQTGTRFVSVAHAPVVVAGE